MLSVVAEYVITMYTVYPVFTTLWELGRWRISLRKDVQTFLIPDTSFNSSGGIPKCSRAWPRDVSESLPNGT